MSITDQIFSLKQIETAWYEYKKALSVLLFSEKFINDLTETAMWEPGIPGNWLPHGNESKAKGG